MSKRLLRHVWFILACFFILCIVAAFVVYGNVSESLFSSTMVTMEAVGSLRAATDISLEAEGREHMLTASQIAEHPWVQEVMSEVAEISASPHEVDPERLTELRSKLESMLQDFWLGVSEERGAEYLNIYLAGESQPFFTFHATTAPTNSPGPRVAGMAVELADTVMGFEADHTYVGIRAASPVFADQGETVIAAVEVGSDLNGVAQSLGRMAGFDMQGNMVLLLRGDVVDALPGELQDQRIEIQGVEYVATYTVGEDFNFLTEANDFEDVLSTEGVDELHGSPFILSQRQATEEDLCQGDYSLIKRVDGLIFVENDRLYGVQAIPLLTCFPGEQECKEDESPQAIFLMWAEFPQLMTLFRQDMKEGLKHGLVVYVMIIVVLAVCWRYANKRMRRLINEQAEKLQDAEQNYRSIYENAVLGIFQMVPVKGFVNINQAGAEILGYESPEEIMGIENITGDLYFRPEDRNVWVDMVRRQGHVNNYELLLKKKDQTMAWVMMNARLAENNDGQEVIEGFVMDVTAEKTAREALKQSEERFRRMLEATGEGFLFLDKELCIQEVNNALLKMFGYTREEVLGRTPLEFVTTETKKRLESGMAGGVEHAKRFEAEYITKNGRILPALINSNGLLDDRGDIVGYVAFITDIAEIKRVETELRRAKVLAEEGSRAKSEFLARMSHEIRTPMNAVIGMAHLALQTELTARQNDYLSKILAASDSLLGIINDILDFSKIEAGKLDLDTAPFNLDEVLGSLANMIALKAEEKDIEILFPTDTNVPRSLVGDPLRLGQVLTNLATNAVKFTEHGEVVISTSVKERSPGKVVLAFSVRDTGIGMSGEQVRGLFEPFQQADGSITRRYGGTGLGLSIAKRIVEAMGGEIKVASQEGRGSEFVFFAAFGLRSEEQEMCYLPPLDLRNMRVLVVDDNPTAREVLGEALGSMSFRAEAAGSSAEAMAMLTQAAEKDSQDPYRLAIVDWKMPDQNGMELVEQIQLDSRLSSTKRILMLTAYGKWELMDQARKAGADAVVVKPVNQSLLFDAISEAFGQEVSRRTRPRGLAVDRRSLFARLNGARALLVEDNEINRQVATELLLQAGMAVSTAATGEQGVSMAGQSDFEVILMDIQMPGMDGYEAARRILDNGVTTPIIAMTAHAMAGDREKALAAGMKDHVAKPINPDDLYGVLGKWVGESAAGGMSGQDFAAPFQAFAPEIPPMEYIDTKEGLWRVGGARSLYLKLLREFPQQDGGAAKEIRSALEQGDMDKARRLAHTMKSVAGNLGAKGLAEAAANLSQALAREKSGDWAIELKEFEQALDNVLRDLANLGEHPQSATEAPGRKADSHILTASLKALEPHLKTAKPKQCAQALESIESLGWPGELADSIRRLGRLAGEYRFREALGVLQECLAQLADMGDTRE
ncbi:MAG: response regulator [Desulfovibrio sp.]|nr:MAG: response regulator [Desulfovibrio sp.]